MPEPKTAPADQIKGVEARLADIRARQGDTVRLDDVAGVVVSLMTSMEGELSAVDIKLQRELGELVSYLKQAKSELATLRSGGFDGQSIPAATDELDMVVSMTQDAASQILDCAERITDMAAGMTEEQAQKLIDISTRIFEASNFQDLTGQRITKVVKVLRHIEERLGAMALAAGETIEHARSATGLEAKPASDADLLHGPSLPGKGNTQDEIDALLADMG
jgi:chemotaxis protein CheZ